MNDVIYRQDAVEAIENSSVFVFYDDDEPVDDVVEKAIISTKKSVIVDIKNVPFAESEIKPISYLDCTNALLMMWIDNVLTDGEYNRIMDRFNAKHMMEVTE